MTPRIDFDSFVKGVMPIGLIMGVEIGLSNTSLHLLSMALKTMIHACGPAAVLLCAWMLNLEALVWQIQLVLLLVVGGGILSAVSSATDGPVSNVGLILAVGGLLVQGCRWSFTQIVLKSGGKLKLTDDDRREVLARLCGNVSDYITLNEDSEAPHFNAMYHQSAHVSKATSKPNTWDTLFDAKTGTLPSGKWKAATAPDFPLDLQETVKAKIGSKTAHVTKIEMLALMNPLTAIVCLVFAAIFERGAFDTPIVGWGVVIQQIALSSLFVLAKMALDLKLIQMTSAFTFSLAGVLHNLLIVLGGVIIFGDRPPLMAWVGFAIISSGVVVYAWYKSKTGGSAGH